MDLAPKTCEHRQSSVRGIEGRGLKLCCSQTRWKHVSKPAEHTTLRDLVIM